jgi:O-6-methylguanine DNA methyltransferase
MKKQMRSFSKHRILTREEMTPFMRKVFDVVRKIPRGQMMTYAGVATKAGYPGASRAVGTALSKNYDPAIPCHRVIGSDGKIGQYNRGGPNAKRKILKKEGALK